MIHGIKTTCVAFDLYVDYNLNKKRVQ